jgi:hypothetical protein
MRASARKSLGAPVSCCRLRSQMASRPHRAAEPEAQEQTGGHRPHYAPQHPFADPAPWATVLRPEQGEDYEGKRRAVVQPGFAR